MAGDFFKALNGIGFNVDSKGRTPAQQASLPYNHDQQAVSSTMEPSDVVGRWKGIWGPANPETVINQPDQNKQLVPTYIPGKGFTAYPVGLPSPETQAADQAAQQAQQEPGLVDRVVSSALFGLGNVPGVLFKPGQANADEGGSKEKATPSITAQDDEPSLPSLDPKVNWTRDELLDLDLGPKKKKGLIAGRESWFDAPEQGGSDDGLFENYQNAQKAKEVDETNNGKLQRARDNVLKTSAYARKLQDVIDSDQTSDYQKQAAQGYLDELMGVVGVDGLEEAPSYDEDAAKRFGELRANAEKYIKEHGSAKDLTFDELLNGNLADIGTVDLDEYGDVRKSKQGIPLNELRKLYENDIYNRALEDAAYKQALIDAGFGDYVNGWASYADLGDTLDPDLDPKRRAMTAAIFGLDGNRDLEIEGLRDIFLQNNMINENMSDEEMLDALMDAHWSPDRIINKSALASDANYLRDNPINGMTAAYDYMKHWYDDGTWQGIVDLMNGNDLYKNVNGDDWTQINGEDLGEMFSFANAAMQADKGKLLTNDELAMLNDIAGKAGDYAGIQLIPSDADELGGYSAYDWADTSNRDYSMNSLINALAGPYNASVSQASLEPMINPYQEYGMSLGDDVLFDYLANHVGAAYDKAGSNLKVGRSTDAKGKRVGDDVVRANRDRSTQGAGK